MLLEKLLNSLEVEVRPFAMCDVRRGWRLRLLGSDRWAMHFIQEGRGLLAWGVQPPRSLEKGFLVIIPPGVEHSINCANEPGRVVTADPTTVPDDGRVVDIVAGDGRAGLTMACGRVDATRAGGQGLFDQLREPLVEDFSDSGEMQGIFGHLLKEQEMAAPGEVAMAKALMTQCLVLLLRRLCKQADCRLPWLGALEDPRLALVLDTILEEPARSYSLELLADLAGMSRSSFAEKFMRAFGRSAADFVKETRIRRGAQLLRTTDLPIKTVAAQVGYASRSHFSRAFAEQFGLAPTEYRLH